MAISPTSTSRLDVWTRRITRWLGRLVYGISKHWLLVTNAAIALYAGLPLLAPLLMHRGHTAAGRVLYLIFGPLCHQLPERSFFLFGPRLVYSLEELVQRSGLDPLPLRYIGNASIGWKTAVCQRDVAIYVVMLITGILFGLLGRRFKPLPLRGFVALIVPMAVDGMGQLVHLWSSTWLTRVVTGGLFGVACVLLTFPHINRGMAEVRQSTNPAAWEQPL